MHNMREIKYIEIAEELMKEIRLGKFKAGEKLYSRSQLAAKYKIGAITAVRVQDYLAKHGYVRKVHGGGIFVNYDKDSLPMKLEQNTYQKIKKIIELRFSSQAKDSFSQGFFKSIQDMVSEKGITYQLHVFTPSEVSTNSINLLPIDFEAGYIVLGVGPMSMIYSILALINPCVHNVLMDSIIPGSNCVLTDSFDGMEKIIDYAVGAGCKRFVFAKNFAPHLGDIYNEERSYAALKHCQRRGYDCTIVDSGSYDELISVIRTGSIKTAVMFPQDEPAYRLKKLIHGEKNNHVLVTGFDDFAGFETSDIPLTTIRVDQKGIAQASIEILCGKHIRRKKIVRIPGQLIVRD